MASADEFIVAVHACDVRAACTDERGSYVPLPKRVLRGRHPVLPVEAKRTVFRIERGPTTCGTRKV